MSADGSKILLVEDDDDDFLLMRRALKEAYEPAPCQEIQRVADGEALMDYLCHRGSYKDPRLAPVPSLILLDLNLPKKDGREALKEIKADPKLRHIPIVVLTTSQLESDIRQTYDLGVNSFVRKPVDYDQLVYVMKTVKRYWFDVVVLPENGRV